ncbi:beta-1,3-galactosyl-O-glycosyl-glycoprotein beta-1,6-N-acetylglucosaminyltransferase-like [Protopterus annectens]|uniref:beta-1,3-galactosyl-O-glycosyl-glycoprotein beta-1,6-N-acetylglucosaminyltransferase-like n=1 Tax=Protopterus annectens TaxID=7888 RepID=UPI001CFC2A57|nr:beta-1,3-galactosyl-O-glycosyl-glycoprotein beta-1,6-N-acetylglucosaminyltransferase-like [Protopterus annectens]
MRIVRLKPAKLLKGLIISFLAILGFSVINVKHKHFFVNYNPLELTEYSHNAVNCSAIVAGNQDEIDKAKLLTLTVEFKNRTLITEGNYTEWTRDCSSFIKQRKYIMQPLSKLEANFPIAYSIIIHQRIDMFERLLRTIYQPQNYYCVHVDRKSPESFLTAIKGIASCFNNVFIASKLESVVYASWSRVQADLNCIEDLQKVSTSWKYLINLCGMDFPIKTNLEIVEKLMALKGGNSLETEKMSHSKEGRWKTHHEIVGGHIKNTGTPKKPPPIATPVFSGSAYFVVSRKFVDYIMKDDKILQLFNWSKDTYSPDEFIWATLQRIPEVPGSVPLSDKYDSSDMNSVARFVQWNYFEGDLYKGAPYPPCRGVHVRAVCIFGAGNLNWMLQNHHLFANKFDTQVDEFAVRCLENHLRHKSLNQQRH